MYINLQTLFFISVEPPDPVKSLLGTSTILDGDINLAQQLLEWVEDKTFCCQLCYTASDDGWGSDNFHRKCDYVGPTVTLVKCGTNIFGGYTDRSWKPLSGMFLLEVSILYNFSLHTAVHECGKYIKSSYFRALRIIFKHL